MMRISVAGFAAAFFLTAGSAAMALGAAPTPAGQSAQPVAAAQAPQAPQAAAAANALGLDVFAALHASAATDTTVISPYDIALTLNLLAQGAGGKTADVFEKGLHLNPGLTLSSAGQAMASLRGALPSGAGVSVETATGVWAGQGFVLRPAYVAKAKSAFGAAAATVDFSDPKTIARINAWVGSATHGKIPHLLDTLPADTRVVLGGALYVKAAWQDKFDPAATAPADFVRADGRTVSVPTMHKAATFAYVENAAVQAVALPFRDPHYELIVVLPKPGQEAAVRAAIGQGGASALDAVRFVERAGKLAMPKAKLAWSGDLLEPLKRLGLSEALTEGAVYDAMSDQTFAVGAVAHKVVFDMDEDGAEAAAATAVVGVRSVAAEAPFVMTVDRPYYFVLREKLSGAILFAGFVADPGTAAVAEKAK